MKTVRGIVGGLSPRRTSTSKDSSNGASGGGGGSESGGVNTENWSFYGRGRSNSDPRPAPYLVGPVVGAVTGTTARILVEMADAQDVTAEAFVDSDIVWTQTKRVAGKKPTVFVVENLIPGERVRVTFNVGEFGQEREARFVTPSDKDDWKIGVVSCNCHSRMEPIGLWEKLCKVVGEVDCIVHLGDQVYADMDVIARQDPSSRFNSAWTACLAIIDLAPPDQWESHREQLLECYRRTYRLTWNFPPLAQVLASTANYMICDDHEVVDDLGDEEEHTNQSSPEFFVIKCAYQVYLEYQKQLLCDVDVLDSNNRAYYGVKIGPRVGLFMSDNRVERSLHRAEGTDEDWREKTFLGPSQWSTLNKSFANDFKDCDCVLFGAPTPLVFLSQSATNMAVKVVDDARGTWGHKQFKAEQKALCTTLSEWQAAAPNRAVITLAGDVHVGGFTDSWHNKCNIPLHQMTASAVGNIPEGKLDAMKKVVIRKTMAADQMLFPFKVRHGDWILGPNFGLVDVIVGKGSKRPDVTLTLVPHEGAPKVRNLSLGDSAVNKTKCDQHEAAQNAHTTAALMR